MSTRGDQRSGRRAEWSWQPCGYTVEENDERFERKAEEHEERHDLGWCSNYYFIWNTPSPFRRGRQHSTHFYNFCLVSAVSWDRLWFRCHNSSLGVRLSLLSFYIDSWALISCQTLVYLIIHTLNTLKIPDQMHHCAQNWFDYFMPQRVLLHSLHLLQQ